ncbi:response regulator [Desulfopila aestuarii]|uniref:Response regulator receiver domain-containing protein n=1 Tax=Desulfopila aestuarii DSM 18488 TaxID=1121416 RepID=A0A1M7YAY8_9BACT|nr:response regulator [Desulfopila aestuarii]SHO49761.1 Response regulator receiver domain-containing protein [Desulfopila aestuarii DSM 18488]
MKKLLYIEDNEAIRDLVRLILARRNDIEMFEAETGSEGIHLAFTIAPDIILVDITLPDMTGNEVLKQLREQVKTATIPAIAISGNGIDDTRHSSPGFDAYLEKPVNITSIYTTIDSLLS